MGCTFNLEQEKKMAYKIMVLGKDNEKLNTLNEFLSLRGYDVVTSDNSEKALDSLWIKLDELGIKPTV